MTRHLPHMLCIFPLLIVIHVSAATGASADAWLRDGKAIIEAVEAVHPRPFAKVGWLSWRRQAQLWLQQAPAQTEPQRLVGLMRLIALLGDGHTQIEPDDTRFALWYPLRIYEFTDGYHVTSAHQSVADLAGARVVSLAGRPVTDAVDEARSLMGADNRFDASERLYAVHNAVLMRGLGLAEADGRLRATFELKDGETVARMLTPHQADAEDFYPGDPVFDWRYRAEVYGMPFGDHDEWVSAYRATPASDFRDFNPSRPPFVQHLRSYSRQSLPAADAYYVQFNQTDDFGMVGFMGEAFADIDRQKPRRLIIDIRRNFGGDGSVVNRMIRPFIQRGVNPPWQELYLLTGRKTFSAAMSIIDAFVDHTEVTLIGEPAGASPNFSGDTERRLYPDIGLRLEVSTRIHQLEDSRDLSPFVAVDVPAPWSFAEYSVGYDPAVDPILAGDEMRSIAMIARADGGEAARRAYRDRALQFAELTWHEPPTEFSLRMVTFELTNQGRHKQAIEVARLNTEIHPTVWNTWYNLAGAQAAAGSPQREQRYGSYQCVVNLAPENWNVPAIRDLFERDGVSPTAPAGCPRRATD